MTVYRKIAWASAVLSAAVLLGAGAAAGQPLDGSGGGKQSPNVPTIRAEAPASEAEMFTACRRVGTLLSRERFLCYRAAANLANERRMLPRPPMQPIGTRLASSTG